MSVKFGDVSSNSFTSHLRSRRPVFAVMSRTGPTYKSTYRTQWLLHLPREKASVT